MLIFGDIPLFTTFEQGGEMKIDRLPSCAGTCAEIYWPQSGMRIGETGNAIRGKIPHDIRWFTSMNNGTPPPHQLRRSLPITEAAKATGALGFEFYVVSRDPRLADKASRQETDRFLFRWAKQAEGFVDWNRQKGWR